MGTGKGWSSEESVVACRAFVAASEDPRRGSSKKKEVLLGQIHQHFKRISAERNIQVQDRTPEAVMQRYKKARCESLKFEGIINSLKEKNPTGAPTEDDIERAATAVYNGDATLAQMYSYFRDATLSPGTPFTFLECLRYLRTTNTWKIILLSKQKKDVQSVARITVSSQTDISAGAGEEDILKQNGSPASKESEGFSRPVGTKRLSQMDKHVKALHRGADGIEMLAEASKKRNALAAELLEVEKQRAMITLFSMEGTDPSKRAKFISLAQEDALEKMNKAKDGESSK